MAVLPPTWSRGNPVDIIGDAPAERYAVALEALLDDSGIDAVLLIHAPTAIVPSEAIARACKDIVTSTNRTVLSCWLGGDGVRAAETVFREAGIPTYATPEEGVRAFMQLADYRANQAQLLETPSALPATIGLDSQGARTVIAALWRRPVAPDRAGSKAGHRRVRHPGCGEPASRRASRRLQKSRRAWGIPWRSKSFRPRSRTSRTSAALRWISAARRHS